MLPPEIVLGINRFLDQRDTCHWMQCDTFLNRILETALYKCPTIRNQKTLVKFQESIRDPRLGALVHVFDLSMMAHRWQTVESLELEHLVNLQVLDVQGCKRLSHFCERFPVLEHLDVSGCKLSNQDISEIKRCQKLSFLSLSKCQLDPDQIVDICQSLDQLQELDCSLTRLESKHVENRLQD
ncbi:hypothetical protein EDD86DRAFT_243706 [Gorgonomyces haynaldii]|nr:hypothetical protein EDD86DRAFT_243706 [Gorgonomyces haynaldii]